MSPRRPVRDSLTNLINQVDRQVAGKASPDTVPSGFPSLDKLLGGGFRRRDLIALGGDVGAGKYAHAHGFGLRAAGLGFPVVFFSGEMDADRLLERALALEGRTSVDEVRNAKLSDESRAGVGAAALRIRDLPLTIYPLVGQHFDEALAAAWQHQPALLIVDYLQLLPSPSQRLSQEEDNAATLRALKAVALERQIACLVVAQLERHTPDRPDPRPKLEDFGALGGVKHHADVVLCIYREEMYRPGGGVEGATELLIEKNRNGPTGFVDLYFYQKFTRFEDMLDPE
ncbi:MAG: AAA family ATPase [Gemmatimonadetes bacterium]|nr:AAA family ATPase [Gemmatimonadota bacterium]